MIQRYVSAAPVELDRHLMRLGFIYLVSNGDAHLKNWSVYETDSGDMVLTPCYDLVCTTLHLPNEARLALAWYGGDRRSPSQELNGFETGTDLLQMGERFGVPAKRCQQMVDQLTTNTSWDQIVALVERSFLSAAAQEKYVVLVADRLRALRMR